MTSKKLIILSQLNHRGHDCIRVDFRYDSEIIKVIKDFEPAKWSQMHTCWYFKNEKDNLKVLSAKLEKIATLDSVPIGQNPNLSRLKDSKVVLTNPFSDFCSVFISYSFKDKSFVNQLNDSLVCNGVSTFLWEKDAPVGVSLKNIMFENVHNYDRVLFVASENSLKSQACHFELSQAREKQDKLWKTILFPIHIDNFLFEVRKDIIRPRDKADEYWLNICELRDINSLDFTEVANSSNIELFNEKIKKLLINLEI
jgi:hypothetical protein